MAKHINAAPTPFVVMRVFNGAGDPVGQDVTTTFAATVSSPGPWSVSGEVTHDQNKQVARMWYQIDANLPVLFPVPMGAADPNNTTAVSYTFPLNSSDINANHGFSLTVFAENTDGVAVAPLNNPVTITGTGFPPSP